jgi:hypothetical protein
VRRRIATGLMYLGGMGAFAQGVLYGYRWIAGFGLLVCAVAYFMSTRDTKA